jgi:hypothetical protein
MNSVPERAAIGRVLKSHTTAGFWKSYQALPERVQQLADRTYFAWTLEPRRSSLRFKPFKTNQWSIRVGDHYRAVGRFIDGNTFLWTWIGSHEDYNKL